MDERSPLEKGGEQQPQRDEVKQASDSGEQTEPEAFTPVTPLGSGAPWAGSLLRPEDEPEAETPEQRDRAREAD